MVTLKNTGAVELDKDSIMTNLYNCEVSHSEGGTQDRGGGGGGGGGGYAKAVFIPGKTSHPFQERTLTLDQTVKIGRSVARIRPSATNGIFDCKVLSRNHAIIWYDNKKFYIQDTKSSNGTFVNNHRLSKGSEDSVPREIYSGDVVQFGVDVLENQRKGNGDSENSDESNHIVTHGCIVATVKLYYPNGEEADSSQLCNISKSECDMPQEEICKLQLIIYESQQREARLYTKLEELQSIVGKLELACADALTNRFEETRLLSKIEYLEKQTMMMRKFRQGSIDKMSEKAEMEIHQLLLDVDNVQSASREIQEVQHRKLLETEQKLAEAQTAASNLQLEVHALREHASRSESHIQELAAKCTSFSQTIELLKTNLAAQMEANQDLEVRMAEIQQREAEFRNNFYKQSKLKKLGFDKSKLITEESDDDEAPKKDKDNNEDIVLEWISKYYWDWGNSDQEDDHINEDDRTESLKKQIDSLRDALYNGLQNVSTCLGQLDTARSEYEKSKDEVEKCMNKREELLSQLESTRLVPIEKTEGEMYADKHESGKSVVVSAINNEKISELENALKEQEELLNEARQKSKESERKYNKLKCELGAAKCKCEILNLESYSLRKTLQNRYGCLELPTDIITQKMAKIDDSEKEKFVKDDDGKKLSDNQKIKHVIMNNEECQTVSVILKTAETNTVRINGEKHADFMEEESKIVEELNGSSDKDVDNKAEDERVSAFSTDQNIEKTVLQNSDASSVLGSEESSETNKNPVTCVPAESDDDIKSKPKDKKAEISMNNVGIWEKIERIQRLSNGILSDSSTLSQIQVKEIANSLNLIAEDVVRLLLHEQQMNKDKQSLQQKLDKFMNQADIAVLGLAMDLKTIVLFSVTAIIAYLVFSLCV